MLCLVRKAIKQVFPHHLFYIFLLIICALLAPSVQAGTYASAATTFNWIDPASHTKVTATSSPYKFIDSSGCGTKLPDIDDNISDKIPIGFNFLFGDRIFDSVRIMTNGRIQFVNSTTPGDNLTCGHGSPPTVYPIPNTGLNYVMRIYGNDLDPTPKRSGYTTVCSDGVTAANNPCYISFATIGSAPNRQFVVSWKGVPEWVSTGAKGAYDIQIIVQENGEFIYQYGPYVAGPAAKAAQVGYQISSTNYEIPLTGFPAKNYAIRFFVPQPSVEYLMEQSGWTGTGAVIDTSGNGKNGTVIGDVTPVSTGKVCRGASFPAKLGTALTAAIDTAVNVSSDLGNAGTISFWYRANTAWSGSGIKSAQLIDGTIASDQWFFLVRQSNGKLKFVIKDSSGVDRSAETAAISTAANAWKHIAVTWNFNSMTTANNNKLTIFVDGVQVAQTAFTSSTTEISAQLGSLYIGDNRSEYIGLGGTGWSADATFDEVRIYNYELSAQGVSSLLSVNSDCLGHYAVQHSGTGSSCSTNSITISSHTSAHTAFTNYNLINLSTSDGLGNWTLVTGRGTFTPGPSNTGTATYRMNAEQSVVLGLSHPAGTVSVGVSDGFASAQENPSMVISGAGCAPAGFNACHDYSATQCKSGARLFTRVAGSSFTTDVVALNAAGNVDPVFAGKAVVSIIGRATPGASDSQYCFTPDAGGQVILDNALTGFSSGRLTVTGAVSKAWREARVKISCDATNCPPSGVTKCSEDNFALRPASVTISTSANALAPSASATPSVGAGVPFTITASTSSAPSDSYSGALTLDASRLTSQTTTQATTAQSGGAIGTLALSAPLLANQAVASPNATYSEVGYLYLAPGAFRDDQFTSVDSGPGDCITSSPATPLNLDYLSATLVGAKVGCSIGNAGSLSFGRFRPSHFDTVVTPACGAGGFAYSEQAFPLTVTARNTSGATTVNFSGAYATPLTLIDANSSSGTFLPASVSAASFANGIANLPGVAFAFSQKLTAPANVKVRVSDGAGADSQAGVEGVARVLSGRLKLSNRYGSEKADLLLPVQTEYWTGVSWAINGSDDCTQLPANSFFLSGALSANTAASSVSVSAGLGWLRLLKPSPTATGSVDVAINLGSSGSDQSCLVSHGGTGAQKPWLRSRNGSCSATYDRDPAARATFGIYSPETRKRVHVREMF